jgi:hypothetical protein
MVIWGGVGAADLGDGGRYDPALNAWQPVSATGAPSARDLHTAVWTGTRMLVWGGQDATSELNTGARYNPVADAWSAMSLAGAPEGRDSHRAVWVGGGLMIVWGGEDATAVVGSGGRYGLGATADADHDGVMVCAGDCDDTNGSVWDTPGEVPTLTVTQPGTLSWGDPQPPGGSSPFAFDVLRATDPGDFVGTAVCLETAAPAESASDPALPPVDTVFFYLVRAVNACPSGAGPLGSDSDGVPIAGRTCP